MTNKHSRARILLIDDDPMLAKTTLKILSKRFETVHAENGKKAFALLEKDDHFDVILCDLAMPEMSGMDFYSLLQKERPHLNNRIVFLTGGAFTLEAKDFLTTVKNPKIEKPYNAKNLIEALDTIINSSHKSAT